MNQPSSVDPRVLFRQNIARRQEDIVSFEGRQIKCFRLPRLGVIIEPDLIYRKRLPKGRLDVLLGERLSILEQEAENEVVRKVADGVFTETGANETELFEVASLGDLLRAEAFEELAQIDM